MRIQIQHLNSMRNAIRICNTGTDWNKKKLFRYLKYNKALQLLQLRYFFF